MTKLSAAKTEEMIFQATLEEFRCLRSEIELRIRLRSQILAVTLTLFGVLATLKFRGSPSEILLLYPLAAAFLAGEWCYHDLRIFAVADYIKTKIEPSVPGLRWQHHLDDGRFNRFIRLTAVPACGVFVGASVAALFVAGESVDTLHSRYGQLTFVFFVVDGVAIAFASVSLFIRRVNGEDYLSKGE